MQVYNFEFLSKEAEVALSVNPVLKDKIQKSTRLAAEEVNDLLTEVFCFLQLTAFSNERLTPSYIVDLAWHELILFTKYYAETCQRLFGRFIHHYPGGDDLDNKIGFKKTHYWYSKIFKREAPALYWGKILAEIADESDCGV
jgi:hypothetical protein